MEPQASQMSENVSGEPHLVVPANQPSVPMQSASLYVGDLHPDVTEALLFDLFNALGPVVSIRVCRDAVTRRSLGYAYVNFHHHSDAERALDTMNYTLIRGRPCRIMWSQRDPALRKNGAGNVFVKHLDLSIDNKALFDTFSLFGNILSCKVVTDSKGKSRGYGFVHFETPEAADEAIKKINGMLLAGKEVFVGRFLKRNDRPTAKDWTNIYVKNIPKEWSREQLEDEFSKFGPIASAIVMVDGEGNSKGFGFIDYVEHEGAIASIEGMNGFDIVKGVKVDLPKPKSDEKENVDENKDSDEESFEVGPEFKNVLFVCKAQKKAERERALAEKFEKLKIERQSKYQGVNLYVKNLDDKVDDDLLFKTFSEFGEITSARVMKEKSGDSKGFGFVCFSSPDEAVKAVQALNTKLFMGKPLYVALAQRKDQRRVQLEAQHRHQHRMMAIPQPHMFQYGAIAPNPGSFPRPMMNMMRSGQIPARVIPPQLPQQQHRPGMQFNANARNTNPLAGPPQHIHPMMAQMRPSIQYDAPLTAEALAQASAAERKNMIGEKLYPMVMQIEPNQTSKLTGMLLEMDNNELLHLLESPEALRSKVQEGVEALKSVGAR